MWRDGVSPVSSGARTRPVKTAVMGWATAESPEAESLRDALDAPLKALNRTEKERAQWLSPTAADRGYPRRQGASGGR